MARSILISVLLVIVYKDIYVLSISSEDEGSYEYEGSFEDEAIVFPRFIIRQPAAPNWVLKGKKIDLFCGVDSRELYEDHDCPGLKDFQWWMYDDNGVSKQIKNQDSTSKIFIQPVDTPKLNGQQLIIKDFNESNERDYWCVVECTNGRHYLDDIKLLLVKKRETSDALLWETDLILWGKKGESITLPCEVHLTDIQPYSTLTYWEWHIEILDFVNIPVLKGRYPSGKIEITTTKHPYYNKQLTINNLEDSDEQSYLCYVSYVTSQGEEAREISKISLHVS